MTEAGKANAMTDSMVGTVGWLIVIVLSYGLLLAILAGPHFFGHKIRVGDVAERNYFATRKAMMIDEEKTEQAREKARRDVIPVFKKDQAKAALVLEKARRGLAGIQEIQAQKILPLSGRAGAVPALTPEQQVDLVLASEEDYAKLGAGKEKDAAGLRQKLSNPEIKAEVDFSRRALRQMSNWREFGHPALYLAAAVRPEDLPGFILDVNAALVRYLSKVKLHPYEDQSEWASELYEFLPDRLAHEIRFETSVLISRVLEPNVSLDAAKTSAKIEEAEKQVAPVLSEIELGQLIVSKDEPITPDLLESLNAVGITRAQNPGLAAGLAVALLTAFGLFGIFLYQYEPKLIFSTSALALMATLCITVCACSRLLADQLPALIPLPAAALILSVIYGKRVSTVLTLLVIAFLAVSNILEPPYLVALSAASLTALVMSIKRRRDLMLTGLLVGFMQMAGFFVAAVLGLHSDAAVNLGREMPLEMLGGLVSAMLAIGSLPLLESIFGIVTPYRIIELSEPDQPLMRQLEENAPGTYQHSLAVANLAEGGARAIGADVNLVRTGAMYHDIGKMVTPRYFIENQLGDKNPHDFMEPEESRDRVLAHVTNGLVLAQKYGLPKAVQAFIPEHQGTTVIAYFYHKACQKYGAQHVETGAYRYPGPKPQTKESAIVMLADVSEAVTHSMRDPTQEDVEAAISQVFKARWDDGQFSDCALSLDELEKVRKGFVRVWRTLHHDRLKYPSTTTGKMPVVSVDGSSETTAAAQKVVSSESTGQS